MLAYTGSAFFALMLKGTHRVAHLCKAPQLLACWALELLEEQAVNVSLRRRTAACPAVKFDVGNPSISPFSILVACCQAAGVHPM